MKIGIIGGSGLDDPDMIKDLQKRNWTTPYGETNLKFGRLNGVDVVFVPRHGANHQYSPTHTNYRDLVPNAIYGHLASSFGNLTGIHFQ